MGPDSVTQSAKPGANRVRQECANSQIELGAPPNHLPAAPVWANVKSRILSQRDGPQVVAMVAYGLPTAIGLPTANGLPRALRHILHPTGRQTSLAREEGIPGGGESHPTGSIYLHRRPLAEDCWIDGPQEHHAAMSDEVRRPAPTAPQYVSTALPTNAHARVARRQGGGPADNYSETTVHFPPHQDTYLESGNHEYYGTDGREAFGR